jgi:outer membrane lipoprotein SlyB
MIGVTTFQESKMRELTCDETNEVAGGTMLDDVSRGALAGGIAGVLVFGGPGLLGGAIAGAVLGGLYYYVSG